MSPGTRPITSVVGAVIGGVDLRSLDPDTLGLIRETLFDRGVVFFHDQDLSRDEFKAFVSRFAEVIPEPSRSPNTPSGEVSDLAFTHGRNRVTDTWHADTTYVPHPPRFTALRAVTLPPVGGDTCWASMYAAYDALSAPVRTMLDSLTAVHSLLPVASRLGVPVKQLAGTDAYEPENVHPVVSVHPETGRKALYVNEQQTTRIVELRPVESDTLLDLLFEHVKSPDFGMRWRWSVDDVAIWDNRVVQHYAVPDFEGARLHYRATTAGARPSGPS